MRPARVVVLRDKPSEQSSQMVLVHHDDVIEELAAKGADHPLYVGGLPGRTSSEEQESCDVDWPNGRIG